MIQKPFKEPVYKLNASRRQGRKMDLSPPACKPTRSREGDSPGTRFGVTPAPDGSVYVGEHSGEEREGSGTVLYRDGSSQTGVFSRGRLERGLGFHNGRCTMYSNGRAMQEHEIRDVDPDLLLDASSRMAASLQNVLREHTLGAGSVLAEGMTPRSHEPADFATAPNVTQVWREDLDKDTLSNSTMDEPQRGCQPRRDDLREELAHTASPEAVFACACPVTTEFFSFFRFIRRFFAFLFPFLSFPGCAPCPVDSLDIEREFIVSGAKLQRSFDSPSLSLYVSALALCCNVASLGVCFAEKVLLGSLDEGKISVAQIVFPCLFWILNALSCGSYFSFRRTPHGLERMNRDLTSELTALAANVVDSKSDICIYSWDESGRDKVKNKRYRTKWFLLSLLISFVISTFVPCFRKFYGFKGLGRSHFAEIYIILASISICLFAFVTSYYWLKSLDMQRELRSKLVVLTKIAFIERKSLLAPGFYTKDHFRCDDPLDISDLKNGFSGWFTTRSLVMCASPAANHQSRMACMSMLILFVFCVSVYEIAYAASLDIHLSRETYNDKFALALAILVALGPLTIQYLNVCSSIRSELQRHLYIMDVASLYHRLQNHDIEASNVIHACRQMAAAHDMTPTFLNIPLHPFIVWFLILWILFAIVLAIGTFIFIFV